MATTEQRIASQRSTCSIWCPRLHLQLPTMRTRRRGDIDTEALKAVICYGSPIDQRDGGCSFKVSMGPHHSSVHWMMV